MYVPKGGVIAARPTLKHIIRPKWMMFISSARTTGASSGAITIIAAIASMKQPIMRNRMLHSSRKTYLLPVSVSSIFVSVEGTFSQDM